ALTIRAGEASRAAARRAQADCGLMVADCTTRVEMRMRRTVTALVLMAGLTTGVLAARQAPQPENQAQRDARMAWWRDARFGMFIHWGLYAVPAGDYKGQRSKEIGEWIMSWANIPRAEYEKFAPQFNPVKFDAAKIVGAAKGAGMKYIVITSKHHDGFAVYDSKRSD